MCKTGLIMMIFGAVLGTALFFVRRSAWFLSEAAGALSERAQLAEASFWASVITFGIGLFVLILGLIRHARELSDEELPEDYGDDYAEDDPQEAAGAYRSQSPAVFPPDDETYIEPWYELENADSVFSEPAPVIPNEQLFSESFSGCQPEHRPFVDPWIPDPPITDSERAERTTDETIRVPEFPAPQTDAEWTCEICGCRNPRFSRLCAVCGSARGSTLR